MTDRELRALRDANRDNDLLRWRIDLIILGRRNIKKLRGKPYRQSKIKAGIRDWLQWVVERRNAGEVA